MPTMSPGSPALLLLLAGTGLLGERYAWPTWAGALVILIGIALSVLAEQRRADAAMPGATNRRPAGNADAR